jgi:hypothetical protein
MYCKFTLAFRFCNKHCHHQLKNVTGDRTGLLRIGFWGLGCLVAIVAGVKPLCCSCRFLTVNWCWCSGREFVSNMCRMTTMTKEQANIGMGPKIHMSSVTYLQKYCIRRECRIFHGYSIIYQRHEPWDFLWFFRPLLSIKYPLIWFSKDNQRYS